MDPRPGRRRDYRENEGSAARRGCVVPVTLYCGADTRYHLEAHPPIYLEKRDTREETIQHAMRQIADALKPVLCQHPEQWYQFAQLS